MVVDLVVDHRGQQVVGGGDGVHVAGQVQVQALHRHDLAVAAPRRPALDAESGTHRGLADGDRGPLADVGKRLAEADGNRRLALAQRRRRDGGDDDVFRLRAVRELIECLKTDLGHVVAVRLEEVRTDAHLGGDLRHRQQPRLACNLQVGREGHRHVVISSSYGEQARQGFPAPALGGLDLVEREEMQAGDVALGRGQIRQQSVREPFGVVSAGLDHTHEPVGMTAQETRRIGEADARGHAEQLGGFGHSGQSDVDGQLHATPADSCNPFLDDPRIETKIAHDVGGDASLVPHRLDREIVLDEAVAFGVAGDPDLAKAVRVRVDRRQQ